MDESKEKSKDLVQLARLALAGRPQDVQTYILRMARKYQHVVPELAEHLSKLLQDAPTRQSPLRSETVAAIPVDADSRLQLLRHEHVPVIEHDPVWTPDVSAQLEQIAAEHSRAGDLELAGLSPTRTAIFTGPPGVGKTLAARCLAVQLDRPLLILDLSAVMSSFLGRTGVNLRHVLDYAKGVRSILLLDELDAIAKRRDDRHEIGELKRLVTVLLQEIDDWPAGGLLIAATNHPELLDPAVWRRFEMHVAFSIPDADAVRKAIGVFLSGSNTLSEAWVDVLVPILTGLSYSDIERELTAARRQAVVASEPLEAVLPALVRRRVHNLSKTEKKELAICMSAANISQRQINELTGLSRDTIRRHAAITDGP